MSQLLFKMFTIITLERCQSKLPLTKRKTWKGKTENHGHFTVHCEPQNFVNDTLHSPSFCGKRRELIFESGPNRLLGSLNNANLHRQWALPSFRHRRSGSLFSFRQDTSAMIIEASLAGQLDSPNLNISRFSPTKIAVSKIPPLNERPLEPSHLNRC